MLKTALMNSFGKREQNSLFIHRKLNYLISCAVSTKLTPPLYMSIKIRPAPKRKKKKKQKPKKKKKKQKLCTFQK